MKELTFKTKEELTERITVLIAGNARSGKTYLSSTILENEDMLPVLLVSCDGGELSVRKFIDNKNFFVMEGNLDTLSDLINWLLENPKTFKSIYIDNLTELHRRHLLSRNDTPGEYTFKDYGVTRAVILNVLSKFTKLLPNHNIFFTCLTNDYQDEATGRQVIELDISGKLKAEIPSYCDVISYLDTYIPSPREKRNALKEGIELEEYKTLLLKPTNAVKFVGCRNGEHLPNELKNPSLAKLKNLILNGE